MYKVFTIEIAIFIQIIVNVLAKNKTKEIEALEKEKGDLFNQINDAIDESVKLLRNGNDTEAALGIEYMEKLKEQIKDINGTHLKDLETQSINETRRSKKFSLSMMEIENIFNKKKKSKNTGERHENRLDIQKKIDEWVLKREIEKQKIREYREKMKLNTKYEKCPRHGIDTKKKVRVEGKRKLPKRPCCRKCCKKSYLGCL